MRLLEIFFSEKSKLGEIQYIINDEFEIIQNENNQSSFLLKKDNICIPITNKLNNNNKDMLFNSDDISLENISQGKIKLQWIGRKRVNSFTDNPNDIISSWSNDFRFKEEDKSQNITGLRPPQLGGMYAALSHWCASAEPATIVMPTGTGKTETMLSIMISAKCQKLLVVVPTDTLRVQLANKFVTLGLLRSHNVIPESVKTPIVGILQHLPESESEIEEFFNSCNVIISTINIVGRITQPLQKYIANKCSHLFIDEAHHVAASTWNKFKKEFNNKPVIQFTATPFRNDNESIGAKIIFNYPLSKAQKEGYFKQINFIPVSEYDKNKHDEILSCAGVKQLKKDLDRDFNHILMARVKSKQRASEIFEYYKKYEIYNPIIIHSGLSISELNKAKSRLQNNEVRIVICVDMLGEGFDLPQLKIAVFHDIRKSLPSTLQLTGRFTRTAIDDTLGNASIIVNIANVETSEELENLYAQDSDWNKLLPKITSSLSREQEKLDKFLEGFKNFPGEISLQNIKIAKSSVIYKSDISNWKPTDFIKGLKNSSSYEQIYFDINEEQKVLIVLTGQKCSVGLGKIDNIYNLIWSIYVIYWNKEQQLLFINSSANDGVYTQLAEAITNKYSKLVHATQVFKCLGNINRLRINNVGLKEQFGKLKNFSMHTGEDVGHALTSSQILYKIKSNIFGTGYEKGHKVSIGCSHKGRIWSMSNGNIVEFVDWCNHVGNKVLDNSIDSDNILKGAIFTKRIKSMPDKHPLSIEWSEELVKSSDQLIEFFYQDKSLDFNDISIDLIHTSNNSNIQFKIYSSFFSLKFELVIDENSFSITPLSTLTLQINKSGKKLNIEDYFYEHPPTIRFHDGSWLEGNEFAEYSYTGSPYDTKNIDTRDWHNVNIKQESQGLSKEVNSIQYYLINELKSKKFDIIFDDDSAGEIADIVTIKESSINKKIEIGLYHLKFSKGLVPGARIDDLYEVCGQAQKSIVWIGVGGYKLLKRLREREHKRLSKSTISRFEVGSLELLNNLINKSKRDYECEFKVFIVQPGISINKITSQQLELLAVTENYLMETYKVKLQVIINADNNKGSNRTVKNGK